MSNLRLWIVVLALSCFGAGTAAGWLAAARQQPARRMAGKSGPFEEFRSRFAATFALSPERTRLLGEVLSDYAKKLDDVKQERLLLSGSEMEEDLRELGLTYSQRIRDHVLPPDRRAEYDALAAGEPWTPRH